MIRFFNLIYDLIIFSYALVLKATNVFNIFAKVPSLTNRKKIIIIANGPSLKKDIKKIFKKRIFFEIYALNYFALTKEFKKIKPNCYFIADPIFWRSDINKDFKEDNLNFFKILSEVNWKMNLFCPKEALNFISNQLKFNKFIVVSPILSRSFEFKSQKLNLLSLYHRITTPVFNNVLIVALWHALQRKVPYIEFYGADFSAFKELSVDQKTNELSSSFTHFYKNTKAQSNALHKYPGKVRKKIHLRFFQIWNSFNQIYFLSLVAKKKKIRVINCSSNSYLDSFERI
jgi:hypothetical protein